MCDRTVFGKERLSCRLSFLVPNPPPSPLLFLAENVKKGAWGEQKIERSREEVVREKMNHLQTLIPNISPNSIRRRPGAICLVSIACLSESDVRTWQFLHNATSGTRQDQNTNIAASLTTLLMDFASASAHESLLAGNRVLLYKPFNWCFGLATALQHEFCSIIILRNKKSLTN